MRMKRLSHALLLTMMLGSAASAQDDTWSWNKVVPAGKTIAIKGIIGDITATAATGSEVQVVARKEANDGDVRDVRIEVVEHEGGVTICAVYAARRPGDDECYPSRSHSNNRDDDVSVDFEVRVPRGVKFSGSTVTGSVRATGLSADVQASSVSGSVRVSTTGLVRASTVSGSIMARMGRTDWNDELRFSTVSGSIVLEMPENLNTDVEVSTVSGSLDSDWPMTMNGRRFSPRNMSGRIGNGGRELRLSTVSGDIELRKVN
jgi:hypothetical protein